MRTITMLLAALTLSAMASAASNLPPRRKAALLAWLAAGSYRQDFTPEPEMHPSAGPHGAAVRAWYSPILVEDLHAGRTPFRKGAAMVKELYAGGQPSGWAAMRKLRRRSGPTGKGWLFYEALGGSNDGAIFGRGEGVCVSCHRQGTDYLRSAFRP